MHIDQQPQFDKRPDNEGAMARADLYKLANYSLKLFKMMESNTQLEGWVQAKITKSADYIASVYHYLEYEMKFSEYGQAIDDSDVYSESQKRVLKAKLNEAKEKIKDLKKVQAEKAKKKEKKEELSEARATDKKKGAVTKSEKSQYFAKTTSKDGKVTKGSTHEAEEGETEGDVRDRVERDAKSKGQTVDSFRKKELDENKKKGDGNLANNAKPYDKITRGDVVAGRLGKDEKGGKGKKVDEAPNEGNEFSGELEAARKAGKKEFSVDGKTYPVKESFKEKCNHTAKGKSCPVHGQKECESMYEATSSKKKCPPMSHIKKMCQDGKSVAEICKMHPDCDQTELKQMIADCKKTGSTKGANPFAKK